MGEGEAMTPAEEVGDSATSEAAGADEAAAADSEIGASDIAITSQNAADAAPSDQASDPWQALARVGAQFVAALAAANDPGAPAHPWIERDPASGVQSLRVPLPPPETARQIARALSTLANSFLGRIG